VLAVHSAFRLISVILLDRPTKTHKFPFLETHSIMHAHLSIGFERDLNVRIFAVFTVLV
jgi:hypothetical protein